MLQWQPEEYNIRLPNVHIRSKELKWKKKNNYGAIGEVPTISPPLISLTGEKKRNDLSRKKSLYAAPCIHNFLSSFWMIDNVCNIEC